jgi:rRNA biogenesis protein RRP5
MRNFFPRLNDFLCSCLISTKTEEKKPKSTPAGLLALSVSSDTTDFVRGKPAEVVTTFEKPAHESDNLFGTKKTETKVNKKRKAAPDGQGGTSKRRLAGETKQQLHAHILSYGSLVLGMTIIGAVKQVNELDLSVSLPNGLSGFLSLRETSDVMSDLVDAYINGAEESDEENSASSNLPKLADLFKPGQLIRTVVISLEKKNNHKRIELSMRSSLFNKPLQGISKKQLKGLQIHGAVQSVQDHGCIVSLGIRDSDDKEITGFIPKAQDVTFVKGAPVECVVTSISKATLSLTADGVQSCMLPQETWSMDALQAGMLVNTTVDQVLPSGLNLSFLGMFFGTVSATHLGMALESFRVKQALVARILYVVPGKRRVGFTLLPNLVANTPHIFPSGVGRGLKIDDAIVSRVDANGLLLTCAVVSTVVQEVKAATQKKKSKTAEVKTEEKQIRTEFTANVHISQAADNHVEDLSKRFTEGQSLACRIIGFDFLDGVAIATLKESVLNETFLSYADVKAGDVVSAKVDSVKSVGLFVLLSKNVKGICKTFQLGDGVVKDMARRFPVGKSLKARVLSVNPENKKLFVTLKKSLITSTYPTLSSYEMCTKGTVAHGFVTSVKDSGVIVEFYNSVHGLVPIQRLRKKNILAETQSATEVFSPGQVLKVKVRTSDAKREKLLLDVVIGAESAEANLLDDTPVAKSQGKTRVGTVVSGKIKNIKEDGSLVIAVDQYPEV